ARMVGYAEGGKWVGEVEGATDAEAGAPGGAELGDVLAVQQPLPRRCRQLSRDQVEVGGLAGAIGADDRRQGAGMESRAHAVDGLMAAKADAEIARLQLRCGHASRRRSTFKGRGASSALPF